MNDLDLYNACMRLCIAFGNAVTHKSELDNARLCFDEIKIDQLSHRIKIEERLIQNEYNRLCEVIEKLNEE